LLKIKRPFCRNRIINPDFLVSNGSPEAMVLARIGDDDHVIIKIVMSIKLLVEIGEKILLH